MQRRVFLSGAFAAAGVMGLGEGRMAQAAGQATGLYVPPEEARHARTFMQWPVTRQVYADPYFREAVQDTIAHIANEISAFEPVVMLAAKEHHNRLRSRLSSGVTLWDIPTDDLWCRDSGPLFAITDQGSLAVSHIQFNGWGAKQRASNDEKIAQSVAQRLGIPVIPSQVVGEPGGVDHDGHGLMIAHESSWIDPKRNPGLSRRQIEQRLLAAYGADRMIWSPGVQREDITDYHIDGLARFTGPGRILLTLPDDPDPMDPFHQAALETHDRLVDAGLAVEVIPDPVEVRVNSVDFVASYANYYVCNGAVIMAQFGDPEADPIAKAALRRHYPGREIVALNVDVLGELGGGIHCATQQMPAL
ncbi:MAG: agmatine deiminase family protein [Rhodospirillaceae bacterium]